MHKFSSKVFVIWGNPYVSVPAEMLAEMYSRLGKDKGPLPVRGRLNGAPFTQTIVKFRGEPRLYINGVMLKAAKMDYKKDIAHIEVEYDPQPPTFPMPIQFKKALAADKKAKAAYDGLIPSRKKEILRYLGFMKTEESLLRNVDKIILHLLGKETDTLYPLMHRKKPA